MFNTVVLLGLLRKKIGCLDGHKIVTSLARIALASAAMAFVVWLMLENLSWFFKSHSQVIELVAAFFLGFLTYSIACVALRVNEFKRIKHLFKGRSFWGSEQALELPDD
jgi:peptidoglycan biosynthesis protein MviN/MurJ (putative lipid II flippase)